jgi:[ribosomal protein S5]-alanine N-acetyltransferase
MMSPSKLATNRTILRPIDRADISSIHCAANTHEIADSIISIPHPYPDGEAARYVCKQILEFERGRSVRSTQPELIGVFWVP